MMPYFNYKYTNEKMKLTEIKYRSGYPTIGCINKIINEFFLDSAKLNYSNLYLENGHLVWRTMEVENKIDDFVLFLKKLDIDVVTRVNTNQELDYSGYIEIKKIKNAKWKTSEL